MNRLTDRFEDRLEPLGIAVGGFLVLMAIATIAGSPWTTNPETAAVSVQIVGSLATIALGAGIAYLSWSGRK